MMKMIVIVFIYENTTIVWYVFQASLIEFYNPGRFFLLAQSPKLLGALQSISKELQKTYSTLSVMSHMPFVGEVCAVQYSCDMVRRSSLKKNILVCSLALFLISVYFLCVELVQRPCTNFFCWSKNGQHPLHWFWQWRRCSGEQDPTLGK